MPRNGRNDLSAEWRWRFDHEPRIRAEWQTAIKENKEFWESQNNTERNNNGN